MRIVLVLLWLAGCEKAAEIEESVASETAELVEPDPATGEVADLSAIPRGDGWQRGGADIECHRECTGLPGALRDDGTAPDPTCQRFDTAHCVTFVNAGRREAWCYCAATDCAHRRASLIAGEYGARSEISNCTPVP
jgi:hypothetical protein